MPFGTPDTGKTLSLKYRPGQDTRIATTNSQSVFTFGDYRVEREFTNDNLTGDTLPLQFDNYGTLENLGVQEYTPSISFFVKPNELNLERKDPTSYTYFSSFYIEVAAAINSIVENYPYAILNTSTAGGDTLFDYSEENNLITLSRVSKFKMRISDLINQGNVRVNSGNTRVVSGVTNGDISVVQDYRKFAIQLRSGTTSYHKITTCIFSSDTVNDNYVYFEVDGSILGDGIFSTTQDVYIRPSKERYKEYKQDLNPLEYQVLLNGSFYIPDVELDDDTVIEETYTWPKNIDGFNPDTYGTSFTSFKEDILKGAQNVDEAKTNIFLKSIIPETYLEADSERQVYRTIIQTYAHQFDQLKQYIDGMAYAYTVNYNNKESVPNKFLFKLSDLLGWNLSESFSDKDLFTYVTGEQETDETSFSYFNLEIWKRILNNIVWLYKRKGTRDALTFIFDLIGAPDCLVNLTEFVYDIQQYSTAQQPISNPTIGQIMNAHGLGQSMTLSPFSRSGVFTPPIVSSSGGSSYSPIIPVNPIGTPGTFLPLPGTQIQPITTAATISRKINSHGYINYEASEYEFQEGGEGRGNGQAYINQWRPEFELTKRVDNIKVQSGNPQFFGTENIVNTKELQINFDPSKAVECDVKQFYEQECSCWTWGALCPPFSALTVPFYYTIPDCSVVQPTNISAMTLSEYTDSLFINGVNPRNRKTSGLPRTSYHYPELKRVYLNYYYSTTPTNSHLTVGSMEAYMELLEVNLHTYMLQLLPSTTIFNTQGTVYRNPIFHRQKFVYKEGINDGSEFRVELPVQATNTQTPIQISALLPTIYGPDVEIIHITGSICQTTQLNVNLINIISNVNENLLESNISSFSLSGTPIVSSLSSSQSSSNRPRGY